MIFTKIEAEGNTFIQNLKHTLLSGFNGIFASLKSQNFSFTSTFSATLENDRTALLAYREAINNNVPAAEAFEQTMMNASVAAQEFAENNAVNILGIQNFTKIQKEAAVATMAQNKSFASCKTLIQEYSTGCKTCGLSQEQFVAAIERSNPALARYLAGLNGAKGSLGGYILSLTKSKIATIALQAATIALNMALTMGISLAIQAVVTGLNNLIHSAKNASEAADDLKSKSLEEAKAMQDEVAQLDELIEKYKELATISLFTVSRCAENQKQVAVRANWSFSSVNGKNTSSGTLYYKQSNQVNWIRYGEIDKNVDTTLTVEFDETSSYNFRLVVTDALESSAQEEAFVSTMDVLMDFRAGGKGLAIGKISESDNFEVKLNTIFIGDIFIRVGNTDIPLETYIRNIINLS